MTRVWLIRHGAHDWLGRNLVGRTPGVTLNADGHAQAQRLADALLAISLCAIYSSPLERALETAAPIAEAQQLPVTVDAALHEIDFGEWTNAEFSTLSRDFQWQRWNRERAISSAPGGESMRGVQQRIVLALENLLSRHEGGDIAVVSHGDVLKAALLWHLGLQLDLIHSIELGPGALSVVEFGRGTAMFVALRSNDDLKRGELPAASQVGDMPLHPNEMRDQRRQSLGRHRHFVGSGCNLSKSKPLR
jgi:probable phosphoglycerate mutase